MNQIAYGAFTGGKINYAAIAADAFGNAIGDGIVQAMQDSTSPSQDQLHTIQVTATKESLPTDTAAGTTTTASDSPLTSNPNLGSVQMQPISVGSIPLPSLADIGQSIDTALQESSLPGGADHWTVISDPNLGGQKVAHNLGTGNDLVWDSTNDEWIAPLQPIVISATREATSQTPQQNQIPTNPVDAEIGGFLNDILNSSYVQDAIGGLKSDVNNMVGAGPASLLTRLATEPEPNIGMPLSGIDPEAYQEQQQLSQQAASQVWSALAWNPSNPEQLQGYNAATEATTVAGLALGGYGLLDAGFSALTSSQLGDLSLAGSSGSIYNSGTPLSAQRGKLDFGSLSSSSGLTGVTYEGPLYRAVPAGGDPLDISFSVNANGRYTAPGQGGLYFS